MGAIMAATAFQTQYRDEYVASFEINQSLLRACTTHESVVSGNTAIFAVAGSGGATAVTRGVNGLIPSRSDDLTQVTCTLSEWHDLPQKTGWNVFASQGDQRALMHKTSMGVLMRKADSMILTELETGTQDTGAATTASLNLVLRAWTILGNADVPVNEINNMFAVVTPAFYGYLMQIPEFASKDFVNVAPLADGAGAVKRWCGFNWIMHQNLTGAATSAEKCLFFHRSAIGHAVDKAGIKAPVGYDEEQDYYWARASMFMGAKLLQNTGVVVVTHDGSGFAAE